MKDRDSNQNQQQQAASETASERKERQGSEQVHIWIKTGALWEKYAGPMRADEAGELVNWLRERKGVEARSA